MPQPRTRCSCGCARMNRGHRRARKVTGDTLAKSRANGDPCWICHRAIHWDAHHLDPWSPTSDHLIPINRGGCLLDPRNRAPAHRFCNTSRGDGSKRMRTRLMVKGLRRSGAW